MLKLKELREEKQSNQNDLAAVLGVTRQAYSRYERGEHELGYDALIKLAKYFDVSIDYLLGNSNFYYPDTVKKSVNSPHAGNIKQLGEISSIEEQLILDFRKLPAQTQDYVIGITRNLATGN